ncbi:MAG: type II toxin-antitoxin system HicA family toxin [Deltaproteobacteria bacterium]|nr:type II toxin-antitoxin system HicA family toxin [Deltaproteobacteria bacterium]
MSYFPVVTPKKLLRVLRRLGFEEVHGKGSHIVMQHAVDKRMTVIPFHCRDIPKGTLKGILKDIGLDIEELKKLV